MNKIHLTWLFIPLFFQMNGQEIYDTSNSELPDNMVNSIYIDSSGVKWFGTNNGIGFWNNSIWKIYGSSDSIKSGKIHDMDYERSVHGKEMWFATDSGLSVVAYNEVDGITGATTYHPDNSGILDENVKFVAVDQGHNRWVAGDTGLSLFRGRDWYTKRGSNDADGIAFSFLTTPITGLDIYEPDTQAFVTTAGKGITRNTFGTYEQNGVPVDGISGASTFGMPWAAINTDHIDALDTKGTSQWYATSYGAYLHTTNESKGRWYLHTVDSGLINHSISTIHIDKQNNVWFASTEGLSILTTTGWYQYTTNDGLLSNTVNCITSDMENNVWIGTNLGVQKFSSVPGNLFTPVVYINEAAGNDISMKAYPNPLVDKLSLQITTLLPQEVEFELYSLDGLMLTKLKAQLHSGVNDIPLNLQNEYKGTILIHVISEEYSTVIKVLKK